nr:unnamed protein product [Digitaria exilis]
MLVRQRQYFEQKRRQQQRPELQSQDNVAGGQASRDQEPRSLDVLNINNLATSISHHNESANGAIPQVDCTLSDGSPTEAIRNITSLCNSNMREAGSQPRSVSPHSMPEVASEKRDTILLLRRRSPPAHHLPPPCRVSSRRRSREGEEPTATRAGEEEQAALEHPRVGLLVTPVGT